MEVVVIYATAASEAEAATIGRTLVEERLAASANIIPGVRSFYWWRGRFEAGAEAVLVLKTRRALAERAVARVTALHSYACPGVLVLPVALGNPAYLDWIAAETASSPNVPT